MKQRMSDRDSQGLSVAKSPWAVCTIQVNLRESAGFRAICMRRILVCSLQSVQHS